MGIKQEQGTATNCYTLTTVLTPLLYSSVFLLTFPHKKSCHLPPSGRIKKRTGQQLSSLIQSDFLKSTSQHLKKSPLL